MKTVKRASLLSSVQLHRFVVIRIFRIASRRCRPPNRVADSHLRNFFLGKTHKVCYVSLRFSLRSTDMCITRPKLHFLWLNDRSWSAWKRETFTALNRFPPVCRLSRKTRDFGFPMQQVGRVEFDRPIDENCKPFLIDRRPVIYRRSSVSSSIDGSTFPFDVSIRVSAFVTRTTSRGFIRDSPSVLLWYRYRW